MNYIEERFARQGALLRAVSRSGSRRRAEESREGEKSPSPAAEVWELAEEMARSPEENGAALGESGGSRGQAPLHRRRSYKGAPGRGDRSHEEAQQ